jgi:hypothetical protein
MREPTLAAGKFHNALAFAGGRWVIRPLARSLHPTVSDRFSVRSEFHGKSVRRQRHADSAERGIHEHERSAVVLLWLCIGRCPGETVHDKSHWSRWTALIASRANPRDAGPRIAREMKWSVRWNLQVRRDQTWGVVRAERSAQAQGCARRRRWRAHGACDRSPMRRLICGAGDGNRPV